MLPCLSTRQTRPAGCLLNSKPSAANAPPLRSSLREVRPPTAARLAGIAEADDDPLTATSNAGVAVIQARNSNEAKQAARDLLVRFPS